MHNAMQANNGFFACSIYYIAAAAQSENLKAQCVLCARGPG